NIEVVAVGVDRPVLGVEAIARALERRTVALLLEARRDLVIVLDLEAEMIEAGRLAVDLVGVDRKIEIAIGERHAAILGAVLYFQTHHFDVELHHPLDVGGVKHDVADFGHGSSDVRLRSECRRLSCYAHWRYRLVHRPVASLPGLVPVIHVLLCCMKDVGALNEVGARRWRYSRQSPGNAWGGML